MIRVVLVDDQELVREGLRTILGTQDDIDVVGEAGDGDQAIRVVTMRRPDVVLMDIRMPNTDGLEATRRLVRAGATQPRVLILTTFDLDEYVYEAMQAGASGFVLKSAPRHQLISAIRTVADGDLLLAPAVTRRLVERFVRRPSDGHVPAQLERLTERELDVMRLIAQGSSNAEIAASLHVAETTVKTHVGAILHKLGLRDRVHVVIAAYQLGLVSAER